MSNLLLKKNVIFFTDKKGEKWLHLAKDRGYSFFLERSPAVRINLFQVSRLSCFSSDYIKGYCDAARSACKITYKKRKPVAGVFKPLETN